MQFTRWKYYWDFRRNTTPDTNTLYDLENNQELYLVPASSSDNNITLNINDGAYFSGGNYDEHSYVDIDPFDCSSPCTIEMYFKMEFVNWGRVFDFGVTNSQGNEVSGSSFCLARDNDNNWFTWFLQDTGGTITEPDDTLVEVKAPLSGPPFEWIHFVISIDENGKQDVYWNNKLIQTDDGTNSVLYEYNGNTRNVLRLGRSMYSNNNGTKMNVRYFRFFDKGITSNDVQTLFDNKDLIDLDNGLPPQQIYNLDLRNGFSSITQHGDFEMESANIGGGSISNNSLSVPSFINNPDNNNAVLFSNSDNGHIKMVLITFAISGNTISIIDMNATYRTTTDAYSYDHYVNPTNTTRVDTSNTADYGIKDLVMKINGTTYTWSGNSNNFVTVGDTLTYTGLILKNLKIV